MKANGSAVLAVLTAVVMGSWLQPAQAQGKGEVVMAAYGGGNGETWRKGAAQPFTAQTGIPARVIDLPNVDAAFRAHAANPQYNVGWAGSFNAVNLHREGLIETFAPDDFPELKSVPAAFQIKAADGRLLGIPVQFQFYSIAYNTTLAKASDFESWKSLADSKWKGKLSMAQAYIAANYDLVMYSRANGGNEKDIAAGMNTLRDVAKNTLTILTSFAQGNTLLGRGEVSALPFYSARIWALKAEGAKVDIVVPKEGALMLPYLLIVPKGAKDRDAYMAFIKYSLQAAVQLKMYDVSGYLPLNPDAKLTPEQERGLGMPLPALMSKLYSPDWTVIADAQKERTNSIEMIQASAGK